MSSVNTMEEPEKWVVDWLSTPRLAPYVTAVGSQDALKLYRWNARVSTAYFELVGWFEVAWRNAIDTAITSRRPNSPHWLFDPHFPLEPPTRAKIRHAVETVKKGGNKSPAPGQVIAELTLGFWRFTTKRHRPIIWAHYLTHMFPHLKRRPDPGQINQQFNGIVALRNRVAHHEPIFSRVEDLNNRVRDILRIGEWINPEAARWWQQNMTIDQVLQQNPLR